MNYFAIDPGLQGTGWAYFKGNKIVPQAGNIYCRRHALDWEARSGIIMDAFIDLLETKNAHACFCELPQFFGTSAKGATAASRGDLVKLSFFVGRVAQACRERGIRFVPIDVLTWKGQLPKPVIIQRLCRDLGISADYFDDHSWDAVGIGVWAKGNLFIESD